jgi:hypothetical protein
MQKLYKKVFYKFDFQIVFTTMLSYHFIYMPVLPGGLFQGQISQIWPYLDAPGLEKNGLALRENLALIWPFSAIFSVNSF